MACYCFCCSGTDGDSYNAEYEIADVAEKIKSTREFVSQGTRGYGNIPDEQIDILGDILLLLEALSFFHIAKKNIFEIRRRMGSSYENKNCGEHQYECFSPV